MVNTHQLDIRGCLILKCPSLKIVVHHQLIFMDSKKSSELIEKSIMEKFITIWECNNKKKLGVLCVRIIPIRSVTSDLRPYNSNDI